MFVYLEAFVFRSDSKTLPLVTLGIQNINLIWLYKLVKNFIHMIYEYGHRYYKKT